MKILHYSDQHGRDKDIQELVKCLDFVRDTALSKKVDLVISTGDFFDSKDIKMDTITGRTVFKHISEMVNICPVAIVKGTESHDGMAPSLLQHVRGDFPVLVADRPMHVTLRNRRFYENEPQKLIGELEAVLTLIPQPTKQFFNQGDIQTSNETIAQGMSGLFAGFGAQAAEDGTVPHILVGHFNVSGSKLPTGQTLTGQDIDISVDQMMLAQPDLVCLGHIHLQQQFSDRVFYSGSLIALNWGENTKHGFWIHTLEGKKLVSSEFIQSPCRKLARFNFDLTDEFSDHLSLNDRLLKENYEEVVNGASVRIDVTTWQDKAREIDGNAIRDYCLSAGAVDADIRIIRIPRQTVRSEAVLKVKTLREKLIAMAAIKEEKVPDSILDKADALEFTPAEELVRAVQ